MTANQTVATNLRRARLARDWTLEETAARLERFIGERWTAATLSSAEGSRHGKRIRRFDADLIAAFAACFEVPVSFFFESPEEHSYLHLTHPTGSEQDVSTALRQTADLLRRIADKEER
jgi:transcriptional regulator with XRE-family HTH domain